MTLLTKKYIEQPNEQPIESVQSSKNIWITVITVIVTALIVCGGVYAWQRSNLKNTVQGLQQQISVLQNQISQLQQVQSTQNQQANQPATKQEQNSPVITSDNEQNESAPQSDDQTTNWKTHQSDTLNLSVKYPNDATYSIETPEANHVIITQEHPGNRIHIRTQDSNSIEGAFFTSNETINGQTFRKFNYEGIGSGYGYMIKHNGKNYVFESVWGPTNDIFELIMTTLKFN